MPSVYLNVFARRGRVEFVLGEQSGHLLIEFGDLLVDHAELD